MDNKEFERKLEQIKTLNEIPNSVEEKIQKAFNKIEENEKTKQKNYKEKSKINFGKFLSLAASFVMIIFLAGNGVAYANGENNIYSWILEKIGIQKEYDEIKTEVNQTVEDNGIRITLMDCGYDNNYFIMGTKIEGENLIEKVWKNYIKMYSNGITEEDDKELTEEIKNELIEPYFRIGYQIKIANEENELYIISIGDTDDYIESVLVNEEKREYAKENFAFADIISNDIIIVYNMINVSEYKFVDDINLDINICEAYFEFGLFAPQVLEGNWKFAINKLSKGSMEFNSYRLKTAIAEFEIEKEYGWTYAEDGKTKVKEELPMIVVKDGDIGKVYIDEIRNSKLGAIIKIKTNFEDSPMVDESIFRPNYALDLIDSQGKCILEKGHISNDITFFTKELNENEEYEARIYKYYERQVPDETKLEFEYVTSNKFSINENY